MCSNAWNDNEHNKDINALNLDLFDIWMCLSFQAASFVNRFESCVKQPWNRRYPNASPQGMIFFSLFEWQSSLTHKSYWYSY